MLLKVSVALYLTIQILSVFIGEVSGTLVQITPSNYDHYRVSKDILFLNFYADWCRFSQALKPVFEKASSTLAQEEPDRVVLGRVDCEANKQFCANSFHISKYPTLKLVRHGQIARREYRGQRSTDALVEFVRNQLSSPVKPLKAYHQLATMDVKRAVIGFFRTNTTMEYDLFSKVAVMLRDDCPFYSIIGQESEPQISFREEGSPDHMYTGGMTDFHSMVSWVMDRCIPLVREITFQNGEEMTEEGLPLLILFYHPDEPEIKDMFKLRVEAELAEHKGSINCVTANGITFSHPLHHLGKGAKDLPILAIDSFRHMYVFPNFEDIKVPGKLNQFVKDLHAGKLHREYHYGPDHKEEPPSTQQPSARTEQQQQQGTEASREKRSDPPESAFKKLQPASSRYSLLRRRHDEL